MFKILIGILMLIPSIVCAETDRIDLSGFVNATYIDINEKNNNLPNEGFTQEAGLQTNVFVSRNLELRSYLTYVPWFPDDREVDFEYFLADLFTSYGDVDYGIRFGKTYLPYGFWGDNRINPANRQGIVAPLNIIWQQNKALYDTGEGAQFYIKTNIGDHTQVEFEAGDITHYKPMPQKNYVMLTKAGVTSDKVETHFQHLEIDSYPVRIRLDHMNPKQTLTISDEHWKVFHPKIPSKFYSTGHFQDDYELAYVGIQYYNKWFSLTNQRVRWEYTGEGALKNYYKAVNFAYNSFGVKINFKHPKYHYYNYNYMLELYPDKDNTLSFIYGTNNYKDQIKTLYVSKQSAQTQRSVTWKHNINETLVLKLEHQIITGLEFLGANENPEIFKYAGGPLNKMERNWWFNAISLTYLFY